MCALSSLFSNFGWPLMEDQIMSQEQNWPATDHDLFMELNYREPKASHSPPTPQPELTDRHHQQQLDSTTTPMPFSVTSAHVDTTKAKKMNHNASERDRRKKLNNLYSALRSLLPTMDQTKKPSIPVTVSRVLKYIPELQKQVERLVQRKEEILTSISKQGEVNNKYLISRQRKGALVREPFPSVSTSQVDDNEVVIQICTLKLKRNPALLSEVLQNLEREDLQILSASSFASTGNRVFYTLHLQVKETKRVECELLNEKVLYLCERKELLP